MNKAEALQAWRGEVNRQDTNRKGEPMRSADRPNQYQSYGVDAGGQVTHAGVHGMARMSVKAARRVQRRWQAWRAMYLRANPGDYPLRHVPATVNLAVHPIGQPELCRWFPV